MCLFESEPNPFDATASPHRGDYHTGPHVKSSMRHTMSMKRADEAAAERAALLDAVRALASRATPSLRGCGLSTLEWAAAKSRSADALNILLHSQMAASPGAAERRAASPREPNLGVALPTRHSDADSTELYDAARADLYTLEVAEVYTAECAGLQTRRGSSGRVILATQ